MDSTILLSLAAGSGYEDVVAILLPITKDINTQNVEGYNALLVAVSGRYDRIVDVLLDAGPHIAPQEPDPHSHLVPEIERISGYALDAILILCLDEGPIRPSSHKPDILKLLLRAVIKRSPQSGPDAATASAEPHSNPQLTRASLQAVSDNISSSRHSITTYNEAMEILTRGELGTMESTGCCSGCVCGPGQNKGRD